MINYRNRNNSLSKETFGGLEKDSGLVVVGRTTWYQPKNEVGQFIACEQRRK